MLLPLIVGHLPIFAGRCPFFASSRCLLYSSFVILSQQNRPSLTPPPLSGSVSPFVFALALSFLPCPGHVAGISCDPLCSSAGCVCICILLFCNPCFVSATLLAASRGTLPTGVDGANGDPYILTTIRPWRCYHASRCDRMVGGSVAAQVVSVATQAEHRQHPRLLVLSCVSFCSSLITPGNIRHHRGSLKAHTRGVEEEAIKMVTHVHRPPTAVTNFAAADILHIAEPGWIQQDS